MIREDLETRPKYHYYKGKIVSFRFTVWGGGSESEVWSIEEFINKMDREKRRLDELENKYKYFAYTSIVSLLLAIFISLTILNNLFIEDPMVRGYLGIIVLIVSVVAVCYFEKKFVRISDSSPDISNETASIREQLYRSREV